MIKTFLATSVATISVASPAMAVPLTDVAPTNWAYGAIQSLNEKYGCIAGYPDKTFKPSQYATRAEMAALVNACVDRIAEFQNAADAQLASALKAQAAQWSGTQAAVSALQLAANQKAQGVGNYVAAGVLLNKQGVNGNGYSSNRTVSGANLQVRYAVKTFSNSNAVSVRPYVNFASSPLGQIGSAGGALVSYDLSILKRSGVSAANVYAGAGYQIPFVNKSQSNFQSAIGNRGQVVFALGLEGRLSNSIVGYSQLTFPTTNAGNSYGVKNASYSPVFSTGLGIKF